jgi:hypothetical protein
VSLSPLVGAAVLRPAAKMPLDISREFRVWMYKYMHHKALGIDSEATFIGFSES